MMKIVRYFLPLLTIWMLACNSGDEQANADAQNNAKNQEKEDYWSANNCLRSVPESTLDSAKLHNYSFTLMNDHGIEVASWPNGDSLIVLNEGCELYWFSYTYIVPNYDKNASNIDLVEYCFNRVMEVDVAPIDFHKAIEMLEKIKKGGGQINMGREYFLKMERVSEMFEVEEVDLKKEYAVVKFSFAVGHL